jgi:hypothetical protein
MMPDNFLYGTNAPQLAAGFFTHALRVDAKSSLASHTFQALAAHFLMMYIAHFFRMTFLPMGLEMLTATMRTRFHFLVYFWIDLRQSDLYSH